MSKENNTDIKKRIAKQLIKVRYCSRCGHLIDNETKVCSGCGKQYFKGIKLKKSFLAVSILSLMLLISVFINVVQFVGVDTFNDREDYKLEEINATMYDSTIMAEKENSNIQANDIIHKKAMETPERLENTKKEWALDFYEKYIVLVNKNSKKHHKYGCTDFDVYDFKIYNFREAERRGYYPCPKCH